MTTATALTTAPATVTVTATAQINQRLQRIEAHMRQLAAAAAESQLAGEMRGKRHKRGWTSVYDGLANTLAQPGLDELQRLRSMLGPSLGPNSSAISSTSTHSDQRR